MTPQLAIFSRTGLLAIDPSALGQGFSVTPDGKLQPFELMCDGAIAVVTAKGPLTYDGWLFDSYDGLRCRFAAACALEGVKAIVLRAASPGGEVAGAFDLARELPRMAAAAGKRFFAHTDHQACSSAYALVSGAEVLALSDTATVGSIGVIAVRPDVSAADAAQGVRFAVTSSGARKADGNPHLAMSADEQTAAQGAIDATAAVFFELVRAHRGIDAQPLEAATAIGAQAVAVGLADEVASWEAFAATLLERCARPQAPRASAKESSSMADKDDDKEKKDAPDAVLQGLISDAAGKDEAKAKAAKRALKAYFDDDKEAADDEPKKDAADDKPAPDAKAAPAASAIAGDPTIKALADGLAKSAESIAALTKTTEANARAALFAGRPDLGAEVVAGLADLPIDTLRKTLAALPRAAAGNPLVNESAAPLAGSAFAPGAPPPPDAAMDRAMGLGGMSAAVVNTPQTLVLGAYAPTAPKAATSKEPVK